jgi:heavy metal translocating P-type ATPase
VVETCALCGLRAPNPVGGTPPEEGLRFCCAGCAQVYSLARDNGVLDQVLGRPVTRTRTLDVLSGPRETAYFSIKGMWCPGCATAAEGLLRHQQGVRSADVSFAAERGRVSYDPSQIEPRKLLARLTSLGYQAQLLSDRKEAAAERRIEGILLQLIVAVAFGMQVMMIYLFMLYPRYAAGDYSGSETRALELLAMGLTVPVLFFGGISFLRGAWTALLARTATMDTLVALGTTAAFGYSAYVTLVGSGAAYFDSVAMITTFVLFGRYLESVGGSRARADINALLTLETSECWTRSGGEWIRSDPADLVEGVEILVKQGERVPADATVVEGTAAVDESLLTGESRPLLKGPGDVLSAGTLAADGSLIARVLRPVPESRLAQISQMIERTLATKPPIQRLADRVSAYFALSILVIAALVFVIRLLLHQPVADALVASIAVLVVACPCALGLATPLALVVGVGLSARAGIIVRNPAALEHGADIRRVAFDKTGTITRGQMSVEQVVALGDAPSGGLVALGDAAAKSAEVLSAAAAVEQFSEHPVARAILAAYQEAPPEASDFEVRRGQGSSAMVPARGDQRVLVGSPAFLGIDVEPNRGYTGRGRTVVWVGTQGHAEGFVVLRDDLDPTARQALAELKHRGLTTTILSGDDPGTVEAVATEVGAEEWVGRLIPEEKAERVRVWQEAGQPVAMVGDGVNDAPALAQADLALAVAGGTDLAGEAADVVLSIRDLRAVPRFLSLSSSTRRIIRENLGWAFAYNLVTIPLAAAGLISPIVAAAAMAASSLLVVGNSLRLRRLATAAPPAESDPAAIRPAGVRC